MSSGKEEDRKFQTWQPVTRGYRSSAGGANHHHHHQHGIEEYEEYDNVGAQHTVANENGEKERERATAIAAVGSGS
jgi:hypothetical protein